MVARVLSRRMAWQVALVATLTMTVSYIDRQTLAVLAPSVTEALGISNEGYGYIVAAFSFAYLFGTPLSGWWIDRIGARRGLVASVLAWSTVAALHALVPGFGVLFALRIALGIAEGPSFPGSAQTMQRILPPRDRERGFGVLFTGSSFGAMLIPPFATFVYSYFDKSWRAAFLITAAAGLIWIPLWMWVTRSREVREQLDAASDRANKEPFGPAFVELLRSPIMLRALCAIVAAAPVFGFPQAWGSKYLVRTFGLTQGDVGHYLWLPPLFFDAGAILFGDLASRQRRAEGVPPRALYGVGVVLASCIAVVPLAATPWQAMIITGVSVAGCGAMYTLPTADLLARMPPGSVALAGGIMACAQSLVFTIGNPIIGRAVDRLGDYDSICVAIGMWAIPGAVIWLLWRVPARYVPRGAIAPARVVP